MAAAEILKLTHIIVNGMPNMIATLILNLKAYALIRRKRNEASGPAVGKRRRRHKLFAIHLVVLAVSPLTCLQGINRESASENGYFPQIHRRITTSLTIFTTEELASGSSEAVCLVNGSRLALSCGFMENVCSSNSSPIDPSLPFTSLAGSGKTVLWFVITQYSTPR